MNSPTPTDLSAAPIGIFDSGIGGLSVYVHLKQQLPHERFLYYADTANLPYGNKSANQIIALSEQAVGWLIAQGVKLVVIACNSASAHALATLRQQYHIPIVGLVPAIKPACLATKSQKIAVLATQATLTGNLLQTVIDEYATPNAIQVYRHFEPRLVPWVENGMPMDEVATLLIKQLYKWLDEGVDTLVLGCTHYPFFAQFLQHEIDAHALTMTVIDSGVAIAQRVASLLDAHQLNTPKFNHAHEYTTPLCLYASDIQHTQKTCQIASTLIGEPISIFITKPALLSDKILL